MMNQCERLEFRAMRAYEEWRRKNMPCYEWGTWRGTPEQGAFLDRMYASWWDQTREIRAAWVERTHRDGKGLSPECPRPPEKALQQGARPVHHGRNG